MKFDFSLKPTLPVLKSDQSLSSNKRFIVVMRDYVNREMIPAVDSSNLLKISLLQLLLLALPTAYLAGFLIGNLIFCHACIAAFGTWYGKTALIGAIFTVCMISVVKRVSKKFYKWSFIAVPLVLLPLSSIPILYQGSQLAPPLTPSLISVLVHSWFVYAFLSLIGSTTVLAMAFSFAIQKNRRSSNQSGGV